MSPIVSILLAVLLGLLVAALVVYALSRMLERREPYASFLRLRTLQKVTFFRRLVGDPRVPRLVKVLTILLAVYLALPIDLIPDFVPMLGYVDDIAIAILTLALIVRWTPRAVIDDLLLQLAHPESN
jgi:uncharacterized membrane protein YkvA (DUF1232 family)